MNKQSYLDKIYEIRDRYPEELVKDCLANLGFYADMLDYSVRIERKPDALLYASEMGSMCRVLSPRTEGLGLSFSDWEEVCGISLFMLFDALER